MPQKVTLKAHLVIAGLKAGLAAKCWRACKNSFSGDRWQQLAAAAPGTLRHSANRAGWRLLFLVGNRCRTKWGGVVLALFNTTGRLLHQQERFRSGALWHFANPVLVLVRSGVASSAGVLVVAHRVHGAH